MFEVINENNGNDVLNDANWANETNYLQKNGIIVLGYVHTNYDCLQYACSPNEPNPVPLSTVEYAMKNYSNFYHVNGTFVDEMSSNASNDNLTYYGAINHYAKYYLNETYTSGNPGDVPDKNFNATFDNLNIYEQNGTLPCNLSSSNCTPSSYASWASSFNKDLFSVLAYNMPSTNLNSTYYNNTAKNTGNLYFTDDGGAGNQNPWDQLSTYLNSILSNLIHD